MDVPVGEAFLGRVGNSVGTPVKIPLQTGLKVIDALVPRSRGQRELIVGDRRSITGELLDIASGFEALTSRE
ncbi:hypothetical protein VB834_24635 [Limnoraphis robusta Tam1]|jgi:F-type H+-transporting ATPase subunit alpha|uniref:ATPase F1/V1/A1 complex alpha/beta subunit N-terminal domain-containing protein n=3 Tax=Limnoraphis TaxID=1332112 RepID=A0A0F5YLC2_9CYAN|nr:hypothetical protein [Limnoraphis robusta]KKD39681.1 hypothetical protein WN50_02140 [Limnoraphis robusta CS-951]MEA5520199.1 hypothetical protein [Limnoraphis robusta CCNP1315]MEA5542225.1 hypothetical protein [Limnoraphis robusta Tam1]